MCVDDQDRVNVKYAALTLTVHGVVLSTAMCVGGKGHIACQVPTKDGQLQVSHATDCNGQNDGMNCVPAG